MSVDREAVCRHCKWWKKFKAASGAEVGNCHLNPPKCGSDGRGVWPNTYGGDTCSAFTDRPDDHVSDTTFEHIGDAAARVTGRIKPGDAAA
jgi:hypothetical protein